MKGSFITFEGGEGAGKTTIMALVASDLEARGCKVMTTREPGGVQIAENIRAVILEAHNNRMDAWTEALLYAAARRQHLVEKVIPALEQGQTVLCDRFLDSSLAYQGYARGLGMSEILRLNQFAIADVMPSLTIYLDIDPIVGLARIYRNQQREVNRFDAESMDFHQRVWEGYKKVSEMFPDRVVQIDANQEPEVVLSHIQRILVERLGL